MTWTTSEGGGNRSQSADCRQPGPHLSPVLSRAASICGGTSKTRLLALEAGGIIALAPGCPRWASRRVDRITIALDCLLGREVLL